MKFQMKFILFIHFFFLTLPLIEVSRLRVSFSRTRSLLPLDISTSLQIAAAL